MLLPINVNPKHSVYYNGYLIIKILKKENNLTIDELFNHINKVNLISYNLLILSLDWLYLIDAISKNEEGAINLCI